MWSRSEEFRRPCGCGGAVAGCRLRLYRFKYDGTPEEALAQIDSKQYAIPLPGGRRACVVKIGVNFDSSTRTIGGWKIAKAD